MFETAELGRTTDKAEYRAQVPELRSRLLKLQREIEASDVAVVILVNGVDGSGKGEVVNLLNEWFDTRNIETIAFDAPTEEQSHRPQYWRYWMALPAAGRIAVMVGSWYSTPILQRAYGKTGDAKLDRELARIASFESTLTDGGVLFIKLWLHISKKQQKKHFKKLAAKSETRWRVSALDRKHAKLYDTFRPICERTLRRTSTGDAPWIVIESADNRYRNLAVGNYVADALERRLAHAPEPASEPPAPIDDPNTILDALDMTLTLDRSAYVRELEARQSQLNALSRRARQHNVGVIIVFEGSDAAGKGGAIRRLTGALDARHCRVISVAAPTDEERGHHYLWRFWRYLPRLGRFTIFDRSWYGRVLVERVEGFAHQRAWMQAYKEINDMEEQLVEHGIVLIKFWLHISPEEQLRRFNERAETPWKQYKLTDEDHRNRDKANLYELAADEMIGRTGTEYAPWTLVEAEDKRFARVKVLRTVCDALAAALPAEELRDTKRRR